MAIQKTRSPRTIARPEQFDGETLLRIRTENIKGVRLVEFMLNDTVTVIGGDNGQGKTSLLDSYELCIRGKAVLHMDEPIHEGKQKGSITCDFGHGNQVTLSVTRTLLRVGDKDWTQELDIEIPNGVAPSQVETFLKSLAGEMSFDPMAFDEMSDEKQFEQLRSFVPDFDFKKNAAERDAIFKVRTDVNRDKNRAASAAESIEISDTPPCTRVDENGLTARLRSAGEHNTDVERRRSNREKTETQVKTLRDEAIAKSAQIQTDTAAKTKECNDAVMDLEAQIKQLQLRIKAKQEALVIEIQEVRDLLTNEASAANELANELELKLKSAETLPAIIDATAIEAELLQARQKNRELDEWERQRARKAEYEAEAKRLSAESDELTADIAELDAARQAAIAQAQLPVDGLGFGDGYITLNAQRWRQASEAQRIDASTAIAMALNPRLKVILIRDGSSLGSKMKQRIAERAAARGYRVLMEIVDETGANSHVFIEDGLVKRLNQGAAA